MSKKLKSSHKAYVAHPRYGDKPRFSRQHLTLEEILRAHWRYQRESIFPETAIAANVSKQNFALFPRPIYVDMEKICRICQRWFLFFAEEQKYWFETLGLYIDADCVKCVECRKKEQHIKHLLEQYQSLLKQSHRSEAETRTLRHTALELFQQGYIRHRNKIDAIR